MMQIVFKLIAAAIAVGPASTYLRLFLLALSFNDLVEENTEDQGTDCDFVMTKVLVI